MQLRGVWSGSEIAGFGLLLIVAAAGAVAIAVGHWMAAALLATGALIVIGFFALFAARRSRLVAERVLTRIDGQGRALSVQLGQTRHGLPSAFRHQESVVHSPMPESAPANDVVTTGVLVPAEDLRAYVELAQTMPDHRWLDNTILRNASVLGRDLLAWQASGGRYRYPQFENLLAMARDPTTAKEAKAALAGMDVEWALRLARVVALQALHGNDRLNAFTLYRCVYDLHGPKAIGPPHTHARVFQAVAYDVGEFRLAEELSRRVRCSKYDVPFMRADLLNPFTGSPFADAAAWLELFNENFTSLGLEPVELADDDAHEPFDRLRCTATNQLSEGPLVTVVVSAWQPGHGLRTAVDSLLAQSWTNLEILVVDDASPDSHVALLDSIAGLDPRIRVIRQPLNGGTYVARNTALQQAKGEFVTFLDSDDWSHPRRIEHQVRVLIEDDQLISTTSRALRTTPDLVFNFPGVLAQRENASSLMFRVDPVRKRIGYFDSVRKGADTEFALRIRQAFGPECHRIVEENLAMIRLAGGSLSRGEFKPGWRHPSRAVYRRNYERWHRCAGNAGASLFVSASVQERNFTAPMRFLVDREGDEIRSRSAYDVAFVADLRHGKQVLRATLDEARACARQGLKVAVIHMESFRHLARVEMEMFWEPLHDAVCRGELNEVLLTDAATIGTVVVRDPTVMQFPSIQRSALQVGRVIVVAAKAPRDTLGNLWYEPGACLRNAQEIFGAPVSWMAQSPRVRRALSQLLPDSILSGDRLPMMVDPSPWTAPRRRFGKRNPVIGRMSDDSYRSFPSGASTLLAAYPDDRRYDVRIMGGRLQCELLLGHLAIPDNWTFHDPAEISHHAFLAACDFFVYFDRGRDVEPQRCIVEAMASGCVVILHPRYADLFGDAAVYCPATQVRATIDRFTADPELYELQSQRARAFAERASSPSQFTQALSVSYA